MINLTYFWTQSYQDLRNFIRFSQAVNTLEYSLTLTNKLYTKKVISKLMESQSLQNPIPIPSINLTTLKKVILMNKSLYITSISSGFISIFQNTQVGIVNFPCNDTHIRNTLNFGVLTDFRNSYVSDNKDTHLNKPTLIIPFFFKKMLTINLHIIKIVKKILILLILMTFKNT